MPQRLGQRPFEPSATPASAGLLDGELIYLRPRLAELPETVSDDIADEIAGVHGGPRRWAPADARRVTLGAGAAALAAGARGDRAGRGAGSGAGGRGRRHGADLLVAAACVARVIGDTPAGCVLGCAALPYAFLAGLFLAARARGNRPRRTRERWHARRVRGGPARRRRRGGHGKPARLPRPGHRGAAGLAAVLARLFERRGWARRAPPPWS